MFSFNQTQANINCKKTQNKIEQILWVFLKNVRVCSQSFNFKKNSNLATKFYVKS